MQTVQSLATMEHNNDRLLRLMHRAGWVTVPEAARLATRSVSTIYYWIKREYIEHTRNGRTVFVGRESLGKLAGSR